MKKILVFLFIGLSLLSFGDNSKFELFANNIDYIEEVKKYLRKFKEKLFVEILSGKD